MTLEMEEKEKSEENSKELIVDLSKRSLKRIEPADHDQKKAVALILDRNELQRLDNLDSYSNVKRLSLSYNRLIRMENVSSLPNITVLDISNNSLVCIEGLKDLKQLKHLNLSGNKIKTVDHLSHNLNLEYLDLSQNIIGHISDISFLQNLKELLLHNNEIVHLRQCEKNLPSGLETLTLSNNHITDLNEVSHLVLLRNLKELSLSNNPCLEFGDSHIDFNYRPFVKNWCSSILILDGYPLDDIECLKAEWLYSQGRGRSFRPGEHIPLAKYLTSVCPRSTETNLESEDEKKLRLILSKAQHHQQQLKEQLSGNSPLHSRHKLSLNKKKSRALPERMVSSYHDTAVGDVSRCLPELMTRSLDGVLLRNSPTPQSDSTESFQNPLETATTLLPVPESLTSPDVCRSLHQFPTHTSNPKKSFPLAASYSGKSPVPPSKFSSSSGSEGKMKISNVLRRYNTNSSPLTIRKNDKVLSPSKSKCVGGKGVSPKKKTLPIASVPLGKASTNGKESSEDDEGEFSDFNRRNHSNQKKFKTQVLDSDEKENIDRLQRKNLKDTTEIDLWKAALCIQRHWRGYRTRNLNLEVVEAYKNIQTIRIQDYIVKVANDMEATKVALEGHRKLQVLQMQAINALWKKMVTLQPGEGIMPTVDDKNTLQNLAETCTNLHKQVEELQTMMKIMHNSRQHPSIPTSTQTEIVAVHTPQGEEKEAFPYSPRLQRPNMLLINEQYSEPVQLHANNLISNAIKKVSSETDNNDVEIGNGNRDDAIGLSREESVCLTPACQEGKDLQAVMTSEVYSSMIETGAAEERTENPDQVLEVGVPGSSQSGDEVKTPDEPEPHQNSCSFS